MGIWHCCSVALGPLILFSLGPLGLLDAQKNCLSGKTADSGKSTFPGNQLCLNVLVLLNANLLEHCSQNETRFCCTKHWLAHSRARTQEFRMLQFSCSRQCWPAKTEKLGVLKLAMNITQISCLHELLWQKHFTACVLEFVLCHNIHYFKRRYSRSSCHC